MKQLQTLGLATLSLLSLNSFAQETYCYHQEFELFRQSTGFNELLEAFADTLVSVSPEDDTVTQRSSLLSSLIEIDFVFSCPDSLPLLDASLERLCATCKKDKPLVLVINRDLPWGDAIASQFEVSGAALVIAKDFLLKASDQEVEAFIMEKLEEAQDVVAEVQEAVEEVEHVVTEVQQAIEEVQQAVSEISTNIAN